MSERSARTVQAVALVPDLHAAARAARTLRDEGFFGAAWHLIPQVHVVGGIRYHLEPRQELAEQEAWEALAYRYEVRALDAAARGEADR